MTKDKLNEREFVRILTENDIIILLETWTDERSDVDIEGYKSYNFYRKFKHRRARGNSGGNTILVENNIKDGVYIVENIFNIILWLTLKN